MIDPKFKFKDATVEDWHLFSAHLESSLKEDFPDKGSYDEFEDKQTFFHEKINIFHISR